MDINYVDISKSQICNKEDATLYNEVVACYKNRLYRSGYLLAWILLIESLKRKIIELATLDDPRGKKEWSIIEQMEIKHLSTDVQIASSAKECEIISDIEFTTINSLWQQRCIFAHPYIQEVKSSDLEYIISKLVDITLSKPLTLSKKMIEERLEELVNCPHIIPANPEEQNTFIEQQLVLIKENHYPALYKYLFFHFSKNYKTNNNVAAFMRSYILKLLNKIDVNQPIFTIEQQLTKYPEICWPIFYSPDSWIKLNDKYQGDLFRYLQSAPELLSENLIVYAYHLISSGAVVNSNFIKIYYDKLGVFPIIRSHTLYIDKSILLGRIWKEYIMGFQFTEQMQYIYFLEAINKPISEIFNSNDSKTLGQFLGKCCRNNTFNALTFTSKCSIIWIGNLSFCCGLIEGIMSVDGDLYIPKHSFSCLIRVFSNLSGDELNIILELLENLQNGTPSHYISEYEYIIKQFNDSKHQIKDISAQNRLEILINKYYAPAIAENNGL